MATLAIKGHKKRGSEVIKLLEMLGGNNPHNYIAYCESMYFYIRKETNEIGYDWVNCPRNRDVYLLTLEQFLEKFPYKVGDKVTHQGGNLDYTISSMKWVGDEVEYFIDYDAYNGLSAYACDLQPYTEQTNKVIFEANAQCCDIRNKIIQKEESMKEGILYDEVDFTRSPSADKVKLILGKDYEIKEEGGEWYAIKKKPQYPKTCEECLKVLGKTMNSLDNIKGYKFDVLMRLQQLLICRDAYWKIAGAEMGLGKPWRAVNKDTYSIFYDRMEDEIHKEDGYTCANYALEFPTEEMRDAFYENFKELIEECKELL